MKGVRLLRQYDSESVETNRGPSGTDPWDFFVMKKERKEKSEQKNFIARKY